MIGEIKSTIKLQSWILSFNTAMLVAVLFKLFSKQELQAPRQTPLEQPVQTSIYITIAD